LAFPPRALYCRLPDKAYYEAKNLWFDQMCKGKLIADCTRFHLAETAKPGRASKRRRPLGIRSVVDRASSHIHTQEQILRRPIQAHGIDYKPTYAHVINRCVADTTKRSRRDAVRRLPYLSFAEQGFEMNKVVMNPFRPSTWTSSSPRIPRQRDLR